MERTRSVYIILADQMTNFKTEDLRKIAYKIKDKCDCRRNMSTVSIVFDTGVAISSGYATRELIHSNNTLQE
jgi:hypothetical protein